MKQGPNKASFAVAQDLQSVPGVRVLWLRVSCAPKFCGRPHRGLDRYDGYTAALFPDFPEPLAAVLPSDAMFPQTLSQVHSFV